jgi:hypothetical protein
VEIHKLKLVVPYCKMLSGFRMKSDRIPIFKCNYYRQLKCIVTEMHLVAAQFIAQRWPPSHAASMHLAFYDGTSLPQG